MEDIITEPGIDTLPEYRRKDYAFAACAKFLENALSHGYVPIWNCRNDNAASYRLAEKLGYAFLCGLFTVEGVISND
jgi:RimJ/RimL family protein N-acetyltransferase